MTKIREENGERKFGIRVPYSDARSPKPSHWVYPIMDGYKLCCCDCGLVHDMQFRVTDEYDRVEFRVRRNNRSTAQVRRHKA